MKPGFFENKCLLLILAAALVSRGAHSSVTVVGESGCFEALPSNSVGNVQRAILLEEESEVDKIVGDAYSRDPSCRWVQTGNKGETAAEIASAFQAAAKDGVQEPKNLKQNAKYYYARALGKAFVQHMCSLDSQMKQGATEVPAVLQEFHQRGDRFDALSFEEWRTPPEHGFFGNKWGQRGGSRPELFTPKEKADPLSRLVLTYAVSYTVGLTETGGNPLQAPAARLSHVGEAVGMFHNSISGFANPDDETPLDWRNHLVQLRSEREGKKEKLTVERNEVQELALDFVNELYALDPNLGIGSEEYARGLERICGVSSFKDKHGFKNEDVMARALNKVQSELFSPRNCKWPPPKNQEEAKPGTPKRPAPTFEASKSAAYALLNYPHYWNKIANENEASGCGTGQALKALMTYCPNFSVQVNALMVRLNRQQHGDINNPPDKEPKKIAPSCHLMFAELYRNKDRLCSVTPVFARVSKTAKPSKKAEDPVVAVSTTPGP